MDASTSAKQNGSLKKNRGALCSAGRILHYEIHQVADLLMTTVPVCMRVELHLLPSHDADINSFDFDSIRFVKME